ncbi:MAG: PKD domain-containing protein, partial [Bacteroidota bacterium]
IGMDKAADIAFRNLTTYLTSTSQYEDARFFAIQAAVDLFGECSQEVVSTTNAWYAVGVGPAFDSTVQANFIASQQFACAAPVTIDFLNTTTNAVDYQWDFGDGNTSTAEAPTHTFNTAGTYTITLIVNGGPLCPATDTLIQAGLIQVSGNGGPIMPACSPSSISGGSGGAGILQVDFHTISKSSGNGSEGYQDFSCTDHTTVTEGLVYPVSIQTGGNEDVRVWVDLNNDGVFSDSAELVFASDNTYQNHQGTAIIPGGAVLQTPLRMRVGSDHFSQNLVPCDSPLVGQFEDYSVTIIPNTFPPQVAFSGAPQVILAGQAVNFQDQTIHVPTTLEWTFPGGTPGISSQPNPVVTYNAVGAYPVTLKASNSFGMDSLTQVGYIQVVDFTTMCIDSQTSAPSGILFDSGGPTGPYGTGENCAFLISPPCADSIYLIFNQFQTHSQDKVTIYDGPSSAAPVLFSGSGNIPPPGPLMASSGHMLIQFT